MAYRVFGLEPSAFRGATLLTGMFGCYDTIGDPDYDMDRDETLHERSAYEFVRDQLSPEQIAELDQVDAFWRAHPEAFNADFRLLQAWENKTTALEGFVEDEHGQTPAIPRAHWWWWPIPIGDGDKAGDGKGKG